MLLLTATITPFDRQGRLDLGRLAAHILWLAACGIDGFVPCGTTGEFLYLSQAEREAVMRTVLDAARGRPVYPCTWHPSVETTRYLTDAARDLGASGVLMPPPLYYALDEHAIIAWYESIKPSSDLPVLAYHKPNMIPSTISAELYARLRSDGLIAGIKDGSEDIFRLQRLAESDPGAVYAGGDRVLGVASRVRYLGGFISAIANVWPDFCVRVFKQREQQLEAALADRTAALRKAGGLRAIKALVDAGHRAPLVAPAHDMLDAVPPAERP